MLLRVTGNKHSPCMKLPGVFVTTEAATFEKLKTVQYVTQRVQLPCSGLGSCVVRTLWL